MGPLQQVTCYSEYNDGLSEHRSTANLRYFVKPKIPQDLSIGYEGWVAQHSARPAETKPFNPAKPLDNLVDACLESENTEIFLKADVIANRGILFRLSQDKRESHLNFCLVGNKLIIEEHDKAPEASRLNQLMYIGHAFKEACTDGPRSGVWATVVSRTIGNISVVFAAQIDCIREQGLDYRVSRNLVQLKTMSEKYRLRDSNLLGRPNQTNWFLLGGWYMQSHLVGIDSILVGYRETKHGEEKLVGTENRPLNTLLPPPGYENKFDPGRSIGRMERILDALIKFAKSEQGENEPVKVWRAHVSFQAGLNVEEVATEELDTVDRVGILKRDIVERIADIEFVAQASGLSL